MCGCLFVFNVFISTEIFWNFFIKTLTWLPLRNGNVEIFRDIQSGNYFPLYILWYFVLLLLTMIILYFKKEYIKGHGVIQKPKYDPQ